MGDILIYYMWCQQARKDIEKAGLPRYSLQGLSYRKAIIRGIHANH